MLVIYGSVNYNVDYENRISDTHEFLREYVGPELERTHSFIKGDGWQMIKLAASGFCGTQIWALSIYDEAKETFFRLKHQNCLQNNGFDKDRIKLLMEQNIDRLIALP